MSTTRFGSMLASLNSFNPTFSIISQNHSRDGLSVNHSALLENATSISSTEHPRTVLQSGLSGSSSMRINSLRSSFPSSTLLSSPINSQTNSVLCKIPNNAQYVNPGLVFLVSMTFAQSQLKYAFSKGSFMISPF